ncbi:hypothetical protein SAMN03159496_02542 [Rhizobium sp. NFR07]|uniref:hypothetical protein n=1 Tax=Rhizobium sp. NFR07 TaxID=1566262 RepID=UPI0008EDA8FA|nr:hypothetical protein [Rhizobium sp. NFR07]SFB25176.1 hypothetical protein SAMN03159496_02542 [Rhizobium sp. NFR07]
MIANRIKPALVATALLALLATGASARDRWPGYGHGAPGYHGSHHGHGHGHHYGHNRLNMLSDRSLGGASRVVTASKSRGSGSGSIGFVSGGVVFYSDGGYWGEQDRTMIPAPTAKIIDVNQAMADHSFAATNDCTFEVGVCVIRGGN